MGANRRKGSSPTDTEQRDGGGYRLAKVIGVFAVMASAVAQEYGAGINTVLTKSVGAYPSVGLLIPVAMFVAGLLILPKVTMLARFAQVMPRAGSSYVWLTRSVHPSVGFVVAFLWFIGVTAAMGFLAFSFPTFIQGTLAQFGADVPWLGSTAGHLVVGLALIWGIFLLHNSGIRNYGAFISVLFVLVVIAALLTIVFGFTGSPDTFTSRVSDAVGHPVHTGVSGQPSFGAFFGVVTLFMFAYGGQAAATSLGGETKDASRSLPRGLFASWAIAIVLYSVVSFALFHVAPVGAVRELLEGGHSELATTSGVIGLVAPRVVGVVIGIIVSVIIGKTLAPEMLDSSRYLFAWAQDGLLPRAFLHTNRKRAPDLALLVSAVLGSVFLVEVTFFGFEIGVLLRSMSIVLVFGVLGVGVLNMRFNPRFSGSAWAGKLTRHTDALIAAVLAIVIAAVLLSSVLVEEGEPWFLQPSVQGVFGIVVAACIYAVARSSAARRGRDLAAEIRTAPLE